MLERLDKSRVPVDAAFWLQDDDDEWKFYLHTPLIERKSRTQAYRAIQKALSGFDDSLAVQELNLLREDDQLLRAMRLLASMGDHAASETRFRRNTVNGIFIRDALIQRLRTAAGTH
ncbi:hypothetical protein PV768_01600 [Pseudarthrobacter sp. CC4]|uniref:hypothetical protein n=1 Tax=Pseudarthrobacter sp. CC4 TaxID=3029190 RepID=UPI003B8B13DC